MKKSKDIYLYEKKPRIYSIIRSLIFLIIESAVVVIAAYLLISFCFEKTIMVGDSMEVTLNDQDVLLVNKTAYRSHSPKRFDVIVFNQGENEHVFYNIKRVIGIPGDELYISNGAVYINGELLDEPFISDDIKISGLAEESIVLSENEYFVLGDNRNGSEDSRFANIGNIVSDEIVGKVVFRISPSPAIVDKLNLK